MVWLTKTIAQVNNFLSGGSEHGLAHKSMCVGPLGASVATVGRRTLALVGDSNTANQTAYTPGSFELIMSNGYAGYAQALAGVDCKILTQKDGVFAIGGLTTATYISGGYLANVVAYGPDVALEMLGTNDVIGTVAMTVADTKAYLATIWQAMIDAGIYVISASVIPNSITATQYGKTQAQRAAYIMAINRFKRDWWFGRQGGEYVDIYTPMADTSTANSPAKANMLSDLTHMTTLAAFVAAKALAPVFARLFAPVNLVQSAIDYIGTDARSNQLLPNPLLLGTSGYVPTLYGATPGSVGPDNYNLLGNKTDGTGVSFTSTMATANSGIGKKLIVACTVPAAGGSILLATSSGLKANTAEGHILRGAFRSKVLAGATANITNIRCDVTTGLHSKWNDSAAAMALPATEDINFLAALTPETAAYNLDASNLNVYFYCVFGAGSAGATATIEFEQCETRDLSLTV